MLDTHDPSTSIQHTLHRSTSIKDTDDTVVDNMYRWTATGQFSFRPVVPAVTSTTRQPTEVNEPARPLRGRPKKVQHALVFNLKMHKAFPNYEGLNGLYFSFTLVRLLGRHLANNNDSTKRGGNVVIFVSRKY